MTKPMIYKGPPPAVYLSNIAEARAFIDALSPMASRVWRERQAQALFAKYANPAGVC